MTSTELLSCFTNACALTELCEIYSDRSSSATALTSLEEGLGRLCDFYLMSACC